MAFGYPLGSDRKALKIIHFIQGCRFPDFYILFRGISYPIMTETFGKHTGYYLLILSLSAVAGCEQTAPEHPVYFTPVFRHADSLERQGDGRSVVYMDSAFRAFSGAGDLDRYRRYDFLSHHAGYTEHDYALSNRYIDSMLLVSKAYASNPRYMAMYGMALLRKGEALISLAQYNDAFRFFHEGKMLFERYPDSCYFSSKYNNELAGLCYKQNKFADAIVYYQASLAELSGCRSGNVFENFQEHQGQLDNLGLCYGALGRNDSALYYFRAALSYMDSAQANFPEKSQTGFIREARALVSGNMSTIYDQQGNYKGEEEAIKASLLVRGNIFDNGVLSLADLYIHHLGRLDEARQLLVQARAALDTQVHEDTDELMWRRLQWQYWDTTGNTPEAYRSYRTYVRLRDSLVRSQQNLSRVDVKKEFEDLERKQQLTELRENHELDRDYLLVAIGFSTMAVVIILLIWLNWRRSGHNLRIIGLHNKHLELTLESLEQRNRDYDHLFKMVAHDLRNPISGISGITSLLNESDRMVDEDRQMLALIHHSCAQVLGLIHELLESKANPESRRLSMGWCDMGALLEECVALLQFKAEEKRQTIKLSKVHPSLVLADRNKMWRVLNNLLTNAIKFSPERSVIRVAASRREHSLLISVADTGIGIPEDMREKIFDAFTGAGRSGTQGEQSFGLGLSICRQIVEAHGGTIWFESELGRGSTFYVTLPMPVIVEEEVPA